MNFSFYEIEKDPKAWRERTEAILANEERFKALDEMDKVEVLRSHLYFKALDEQEKLEPGSVNSSKKWKIFSEIKLNNVLYNVMSRMVKKMNAEECLREVDDDYFTVMAYGTTVGDRAKFKQYRSLDNYIQSIENGNTKEFHTTWDAERKKEQEERKRREEAYEKARKEREAEEAKAAAEKIEAFKKLSAEMNEQKTMENAPEVKEDAPEVKEDAPEVKEDAPKVKEDAPEVKVSEPEVSEKNEELTAEQLLKITRQEMINNHITLLRQEETRLRNAEQHAFYALNNLDVEANIRKLDEDHEKFEMSLQNRAKERTQMFTRLGEIEATFNNEGAYSKLDDVGKRNLMKDYLKLTVKVHPDYYNAYDKNTMDIHLSSINSSPKFYDIYNAILENTQSGKAALMLLNTKYVQNSAFNGVSVINKKDRQKNEMEWKDKLNEASRGWLFYDPDLITNKRMERDTNHRQYIDNDLKRSDEKDQEYLKNLQKETSNIGIIGKAKDDLYEAKLNIARERHKREQEMIAANITQEQIQQAEKAFLDEMQHMIQHTPWLTNMDDVKKRMQEMKELGKEIERDNEMKLFQQKRKEEKKQQEKKDSNLMSVMMAKNKAAKEEYEALGKNKKVIDSEKISLNLVDTIEREAEKDSKQFFEDLNKKYPSKDVNFEAMDEALNKAKKKVVSLDVEKAAIESRMSTATDKEKDQLLQQKRENHNRRCRALSEQSEKKLVELCQSCRTINGESENARKHVWLGSRKFKYASAAVGKIGIALDSLMQAEKNNASIDAKMQAIDAVQKECKNLSKWIDLYRQRKIKDGSLNQDGTCTDKGRSDSKTYRRIEAINWAADLKQQIDKYALERKLELTSENAELNQFAAETTYQPGSLESAPKNGNQESNTIETQFTKQVADEANSIRETVRKSIEDGSAIDTKSKLLVIAKIMINQVISNQDFHNQNATGVDKIKDTLPELTRADLSSYTRQLETIYHDPTFQNRFKNMPNDRLLEFFTDPNALTKEYMNSPSRAKTQMELKEKLTKNPEPNSVERTSTLKSMSSSKDSFTK